MPPIKQNQESAQKMIDAGTLTPAPVSSMPNLPIPITPNTYPANPNPNLRGPLPASYVQQPDQQRQFHNPSVPQTRIPPAPITSSAVSGAQAVSQTITIVQSGGGGGGTVLKTNGINNPSQSTLNFISGPGITLSADAQGGETIGTTGFVLLTTASPQTINGAALILASTTPLEFGGATSGFTTVQASAIASGTLTLPAATDTLVGKNTTDTLTNKTLTTPVINGASTGTGVQGTDSKLLTSGTVSGTGATLCTDANGGATTSGCTGLSSVPAVQAASITTIGIDQSVSSGSLTTIMTKSVTMPSSNGPFRAFISYGVYISTGNSGIANVDVTDGTNTVATSQVLVTGAASAYGTSASSFSGGTYANSATVTFTLQIYVTNSGGVTVKAAPNNTGQNTWMNVVILTD